MKTILFVFLAFMASVASGEGLNAVVTADGVGATRAEAIDSALHHAVQRAAGALVVSSRTVTNDALTDKSVSFSAGLVRDYTTLSEVSDGNGNVRVSVRAVIGESQLRSHLALQNGAEFDGQRAKGAITNEVARVAGQNNSVRRQRETAERFLEMLLDELPGGGFNVEVGTVKTTQSNESVELVVPVLYTKYSPYFESLEKVLGILYSGSGEVGSIVIKGWITENEYRVGRKAKDTYMNKLNVVRLRFDFLNASGAPVLKLCSSPHSLVERNPVEVRLMNSLANFGFDMAFRLQVTPKLLGVLDEVKQIRAALDTGCGNHA